MKPLSLFLLLFFISCSSTQAISEKTEASAIQCFVGSQELKDWANQTNNQYLENSDYEVIYDNKNIQPFMVTYKLKFSKDTHILDRKNDYDSRFLKDNRVNKSATDDDYKKSGWDRGHLAPAKDFSFNVEAAESTFLFSNISPQNGTFNRNGSWKKLEDKVRSISQESGVPIQIISGPIVASKKRIKNKSNAPTIPEYFFKVIIKYEGAKCSFTGFVFKNIPQSKDYCKNKSSNNLIPAVLKTHLKSAKAKEFNICN